MLEKVKIADHSSFNIRILYNLIREVYKTSAFMSEVFHEKFHSFSLFETYLFDFEEIAGSFLLVAFQDDNPAGYLSLEPKQASRLKHTAWLNMGVLEKYRGKGIGKMLVDAAIERIQDEKTIEIVYLMVRADNFAAVKLYQQKGFETIATLEKDTKIGRQYFDGILMRKFASKLNL
jgi:ribosomal protein S18 acetylase RimI-like enzyme